MSEYCCGVMQEILDKFDGPFYHPIYWDKEHGLRGERLGVKLYNLTPSKKSIASKGQAVLFLNFCPVCGKDIRPEREGEGVDESL